MLRNSTSKPEGKPQREKEQVRNTVCTFKQIKKKDLFTSFVSSSFTIVPFLLHHYADVNYWVDFSALRLENMPGLEILKIGYEL